MSHKNELNPFDFVRAIDKSSEEEISPPSEFSSPTSSDGLWSAGTWSATSSSGSIFTNASSDDQSLIFVPATTFKLRIPFVYTVNTKVSPCFEVHQDFDSDGRPTALNIGNLDSHETLPSSAPAVQTAEQGRKPPNEAGPLYSLNGYEMRDHRANACIQMSTDRTLWGGSRTRFWQVTRLQLNQEDTGEGSKSLRRASKEIFEARRRLLFTVKKGGDWQDMNGTVVAQEDTSTAERAISIADGTAKDASNRDLVIACWLMRIWMTEGIR